MKVELVPQSRKERTKELVVYVRLHHERDQGWTSGNVCKVDVPLIFEEPHHFDKVDGCGIRFIDKRFYGDFVLQKPFRAVIGSKSFQSSELFSKRGFELSETLFGGGNQLFSVLHRPNRVLHIKRSGRSHDNQIGLLVGLSEDFFAEAKHLGAREEQFLLWLSAKRLAAEDDSVREGPAL